MKTLLTSAAAQQTDCQECIEIPLTNNNSNVTDRLATLKIDAVQRKQNRKQAVQRKEKQFGLST